MSAVGNILILCIFLAEVVLLARMEKWLWGTLFTPLNALSLPFTGILLFTLCLPSSMGFVPFYYPSLLIWMGGLLLMAIPSWLLGYGYRKRYGEPDYACAPIEHEKFFMIMVLLLIVPFAFRLRTMMATSLDLFGSDEFGENFAIYGFFGHLFIFLSACSVLLFSVIRKGLRLFPIVLITLIAALAFVNQVKSWVIIPLIAGIWMCLETGKVHLSLKLILPVIIGGLTLFVGSYLLLFVYAQGYAYDSRMGHYIFEHIFHYLCSGTLGMSEDLRMHILEDANPEVLFAPFINLVRMFTGEAYVYPINPNYLEISQNNALQDNIRTYFGTIYVNCSLGLFSLIVLFWSFVYYLIRMYALRTHSIFILAVDAWTCALLCMGWFDYYFGLVTALEIPIYILLICGLNKLSIGKQYGNDSTAQL